MLSTVYKWLAAAGAVVAIVLGFRLRGAQLDAAKKELVNQKKVNNVQAATASALVENEKHEIEELAHAMDRDNPFGDDGMHDR